MPDVQVRPVTPADLPFLEAMLFEAFFWDPTQYRPAFERFKQDSEFMKLLDGWGRPGDQAVVAEVAGSPVGAAWYRFWTAERHSYGYVGPETSEVGIGVHPDQRGRGIGRRLLRALIETARGAGVPALSLSVAPENYALNFTRPKGLPKSASPARPGPCGCPYEQGFINLWRSTWKTNTKP